MLPSAFSIHLLILLILEEHIPLSVFSHDYYEQKIKSPAFIQLCSMKANKKTTNIVFCTSLKDDAILGTIVKKKKKPKGDAIEMVYFTISSSSRPGFGKLVM